MEKKLINSRWHLAVPCEICGKVVWKKPSKLKIYPRTFCSRRCQGKGISPTLGQMHECAECGKEVYRSRAHFAKSKSGRVFCTRNCSTIYRNKRRTGKSHPNWTGSDYRKEALGHYGAACMGAACPVENPSAYMLDVHHRDGDRKNNNLENLEVLCVWCHALQTRSSWKDKIYGM